MKSLVLKIVKILILCVALNGYSQGGCDTKWFKTLLEEISKSNSNLKNIKDNPDALAAYEFFYRAGKTQGDVTDEVLDLLKKLGDDFKNTDQAYYNAFNHHPELLNPWLTINKKINIVSKHVAIKKLLLELPPGKAGAVFDEFSKIDQTKLVSIFDEIGKIDDANFNKFINVLTKGNATVAKSGGTLIKDNISKLTSKHIKAHRWLAANGHTNKMYDFDFIHANRTKTRNDLLAAAARKNAGNGYNYTNFNITIYSDKTRESLVNIFNSKGNFKDALNKAGYTTQFRFKQKFLFMYHNADKSAIKNIDELIADLDHLTSVVNKVDKDQLTAFIKEMMASPDKFKAAGTSLEVIKNPSKYIKGFNISNNNFELEDIINTGDKFRFDIKWKAVDGKGKEISIFIDTKNYQTASGMFKDLSQFKAYLAKIKNFNELLIIQQGGRAGVDVPAMKRALQTAIKNDGVNNVYKFIQKNNSKLLINENIKNPVDFNKIINNKDSKIYKTLKTTN